LEQKSPEAKRMTQTGVGEVQLFDGVDRPIASANYGATASFSRPTTPPSSSSTVLVSATTYDEAGHVYHSTDPKGIVNQQGYDNASRTTQTIEDVGGLARTTNFTFTLVAGIQLGPEGITPCV